MTNKEKLQEVFPNMIFTGTVMMYKPTEQVLASSINYNWLDAEYKEPTPKNDLGVDCISREQALKELKESAEHHINDSREEVLLRRDRDIIRALPSVTPIRPKGHWEWYRCDMYICSECKNGYTDLSGIKDGMNYCPNCGSRNEVEE